MLDEAQLEALLSLCAEAAAKVLSAYRGADAAQFTEKEDASPLTRADLASHRHLLAGLARLTPHIPVLSEESEPAVLEHRREWPLLWLVDPLDGTREFLARSGQFTINLALVEHGIPRLGLIFAPLADTAYLGVEGQGAWQCQRSARCWERRALSSVARQPGRTVRVLASPRHHDAQLQQTLELIAASAGGVQRSDAGSALKFALLASGEADCYPRFAPCSEWDVAAGHGLLRALGGDVLSLRGHALRYNQRDTLLSEHFLAVADREDPLWRWLLEALAARG